MAYKTREEQRAASRSHYQKNKQAYIDRNKRRLEEFRAIIANAKRAPCLDCGVEYPPYVMEFDHLSDKKFTIANVARISSAKSLLEEIAKCEVVCANCHRERTWKRDPEWAAGCPA